MQREAISGRLMNPGLLTPMLMTNQWQPNYSFTKAQCMTSDVHVHRGSARVCEWACVQCRVDVERAGSAHHAYGRTLAPKYWFPEDHHACWPQQPSVRLDVPQRAHPAPPANASLRINLQAENDRILQEFRPARRNTTFNPARSAIPQKPPPAPPTAAASREQRGGFRHLEVNMLEEQSASSASSWRMRRRCNFCVMNGEEDVFHVFKDRRGRVVCPVLSAYKCRICGATGYSAHTIKYCPRNKITKGDPVAAGLPPGIMPSCFKYEDII